MTQKDSKAVDCKITFLSGTIFNSRSPLAAHMTEFQA